MRFESLQADLYTALLDHDRGVDDGVRRDSSEAHADKIERVNAYIRSDGADPEANRYKIGKDKKYENTDKSANQNKAFRHSTPPLMRIC